MNTPLRGMWPLADPGHDGSTFLSRLDVAMHLMAGLTLAFRPGGWFR